MSDFGTDDLFAEIDLGEEVLPVTDVPTDAAAAEGFVETEVVSEFWYSEFVAVSDVGAVATELVLPDPFQTETAVGAAAMLGGWLARRAEARKRPPQPDGGPK